MNCLGFSSSREVNRSCMIVFLTSLCLKTSIKGKKNLFVGHLSPEKEIQTVVRCNRGKWYSSFKNQSTFSGNQNKKQCGRNFKQFANCHIYFFQEVSKKDAVLCLVTQSCLTLCNLMDCSPPGSSVHGDAQARILKWVAMPSSRGSSQPRDQTKVSHIAGRFFTSVPPRKPEQKR